MVGEGTEDHSYEACKSIPRMSAYSKLSWAAGRWEGDPGECSLGSFENNSVDWEDESLYRMHWC